MANVTLGAPKSQTDPASRLRFVGPRASASASRKRRAPVSTLAARTEAPTLRPAIPMSAADHARCSLSSIKYRLRAVRSLQNRSALGSRTIVLRHGNNNTYLLDASISASVQTAPKYSSRLAFE